MSWWSELWDGFTGTDDQGGFFGGLGDLLGGIFNPEGDTKGFLEGLISMGLGSLIQGSGFADPKIPQTGYQGDIPDYTAVRERVPMQDDPNRRPGAAGQQYFSDTIFADAPERKPISVEEAQAQAQQQAAGIASLMPSYSVSEEQQEEENSNPASDVINSMPVDTYEDEDAIDTGGFTGGVMNTGGMYLGGTTDGMADDVRGNVGRDEVRLSDGEFVIPADVVSHLGNGNSNAGASYLHNFMEDIRQERTGNPKQGKQINPNQFLQA
jgi:hypothetical protein